MIQNYLKIAYRNLLRNKLYSGITIFGLAVGIASFLFITLFIRHELSFDQFNNKIDNIYRLSVHYNFNGQFQGIAMSPPSYAPIMKEENAEILDYVRLMPMPPFVVKTEDNKFNQNIMLSDAGLFRIFDYKLIRGDKSTILQDNFTAVLSETTAKKYFGEENPIGKTLTIEGVADLVVEGVFEDVPENSHLNFDFLVSLKTMEAINSPDFLLSKTSCNFYTYFLLKDGADYKNLEAQFPQFSKNHLDVETQKKIVPFLEPLSDLYLYSDTIYGTGIKGNIQYVYIFLAVALFIIILAAINFINLSTSKALYRVKEVGIRKVAGGGKQDLIMQFLGESVFTTLISFVLGVMIVEILEPVFRNIINKPIYLDLTGDMLFILMHVGIALLIGIVAGIYPALYMSSFNISGILKGDSIKSRSASFLRKGMVVFQFVISIILIIGSLVVSSQLNYMRTKDLGFTKENIVYFRLNTTNAQAQADLIRDELKRNPDILNATVSNRLLGGVRGGWYFTDEEGKKYETTVVYVDEEFFDTYGLSLAEGRAFSREIITDKSNSFMTTESTAKLYGWDSPLDKIVNLQGTKQGNVIGVLKDFNFQSLHEKQNPILFKLFEGPQMKWFMMAKISGRDVKETIEDIKATFAQFEPDQTIEISFLDKYLDDLYKKEERASNLVNVFSFIAIVLGCLGLFGLASFAAVKKRKEVGVRKVLGARVSSLVVNLSWEFIKLVLIATLFAFPIAYFVLAKWLENFAYKIELGAIPFIIGALFAVVIAVLTVSYHAVKAAMSNPVDAIKYE